MIELFQRISAFLNNAVEKTPKLVFFTLLIAAFFAVGSFQYLGISPRGIHFTRQTDNLSFAMGYYQYGNDFFEPRVYDILGDEGKAVSEFPLLYYITAQVAKINGPNVAILRSFYLLFAIGGMMAFFSACLRLLKSFVPAALTTLLAMSGVVFYYYIYALLSDSVALSSALIGSAYFLAFFHSSSKKDGILATVFFSLSALFKVTFLIYPMAFFATLFLFFPRMDIQGVWNRKQWLWRSFLIALVPGVLAIGWVFFVLNYNAKYGNWYFLSSAAPIWKMSPEAIKTTFGYMKEYWAFSYFHPTMWYFWGICLVVNAYALKKVPGIWNRLHWILGLACIADLLLFFRQFQDHDYYFLLFYGYFLFSALAFFIHLKALFPRLYQSKLLYLFLAFLWIGTLRHSQAKIEERLSIPDAMADPCLSLEGFHHELDSLNIPMDARFVVLGDLSTNGSLYFIRRQGYTIHDTSEVEMNKLRNLFDVHHYQYALSIDGLSFGPFIQAKNMQLIYSKPGIELYRIPE